MTCMGIVKSCNCTELAIYHHLMAGECCYPGRVRGDGDSVLWPWTLRWLTETQLGFIPSPEFVGWDEDEMRPWMLCIATADAITQASAVCCYSVSPAL